MDSILSKYVQQKPSMTAGGPDNDTNPNLVASRSEVLALLPDVPEGANVLCVGPARGWEIGHLREWFPHRSISSVTRFHEEADEILEAGLGPVAVFDMHDLPAAWSGLFSLVFASHVLEHSPAPFIALSEWARVLTPGGYLFIVMPNADGYVGLASEKCSRLGDAPQHLFCASIETTIELLRKAGLAFERYHEVLHRCDGRVHYTNRVFVARKP